MATWRISFFLWSCGFLFFNIFVPSDNQRGIVDFCNGTYMGTEFSIRYHRESGEHHCRCAVLPISLLGDDSNYNIVAWNIRDPASDTGGYYNLVFTFGNTTMCYANETIEERNTTLFQVAGTQGTVITLDLYPSTKKKVPFRLRIALYGGSQQLNVTCTVDNEDNEIITACPTTTSTEQMLSQPSSGTTSRTSTQQNELAQKDLKFVPMVGGIAGGVVVVTVIIAALIICYRRRKSSHKTPNEAKVSDVHPLRDATPTSKDHDNYTVIDVSELNTSEPKHYELESQNQNTNYINVSASTNEGYDQVTMDASTASPTLPDICSHVTESAEDDCYNHLGNNPQPSAMSKTDYDTPASASQALKKLEDQDDYSGYDHLRPSTGPTVKESDYDTTIRRMVNKE